MYSQPFQRSRLFLTADPHHSGKSPVMFYVTFAISCHVPQSFCLLGLQPWWETQQGIPQEPLLCLCSFFFRIWAKKFKQSQSSGSCLKSSIVSCILGLFIGLCHCHIPHLPNLPPSCFLHGSVLESWARSANPLCCSAYFTFFFLISFPSQKYINIC